MSLLLLCLSTMNIHRQRRLTKEHVCNGTIRTIEMVYSCPRNENAFNERSKKMRCENFPKCQEEPLVYHCVMFKENLVEVCAPSREIIGNCCPVFDRGVGRVIEDSSKLCAECPFKYQSTNSMKYSTCVETKQILLSAPDLKTTTSLFEESIVKITTVSQNVPPNNMNTENGNEIHITSSQVIAAVFICICCMLLIMIGFMFTYNKFGDSKRDDESEKNNVEIAGNEIPSIKMKNRGRSLEELMSFCLFCLEMY